jgi:hypothetical protein
MKRFALVAALLALLLAATLPGRAQAQSISLDVPVNYGYSSGVLSSPSAKGVLLGVSLPFFLNLGYESYKVDSTANSGTLVGPLEQKTSMFDIFFGIPFPAANLVLGAGFGKASFTPTAGSALDANLAQVYFSLGVPFGGVFDAHVGYHIVRGESVATTATGKLNVNSTMATIGIKAGF